jgi:hypothetical protein
MSKPTAMDAVRQLFESTKAVVSSIERRLTQKIDSTDQLVADLDERLSRLEALERDRQK